MMLENIPESLFIPAIVIAVLLVLGLAFWGPLQDGWPG